MKLIVVKLYHKDELMKIKNLPFLTDKIFFLMIGIMIDELSIIIPTLYEEKYIGKLLTSLVQQQYQGQLQVIVVDAHSRDNTIQEVKKFRNKIPDLTILQTHQGIGHQRNRGAEKAKYNYLFFLDADMVLPDKFLQRFLKKAPFQKNFVMSAIPWVAEFDILSYIAMAGILFSGIILSFFEPQTIGGCLLTTKANHALIDGFRENMKIGEDIDYGKRSVIHGAQYRLLLFPYILHSARRLQKIGRIKLFLLYVRGYILLKRHGATSVNKLSYPFGQY